MAATITTGDPEMTPDSGVSLAPVFVALSAALVMAVSAIATAWAQSRIGAAGAATLAEKPELTATMIILVAIPETMTILGFVVAVLMIMRGG
jgi:V/A-type H+/Na+-transporting ATPase subunit K